MRAPSISADEQFRLIMECRASGLTDHEWCLQNDIKPGTFYNWVKRLRQKGCIDIPDTMFLFYHKSHLKGSRKRRIYGIFCNLWIRRYKAHLRPKCRLTW